MVAVVGVVGRQGDVGLEGHVVPESKGWGEFNGMALCDVGAEWDLNRLYVMC